MQLTASKPVVYASAAAVVRLCCGLCTEGSRQLILCLVRSMKSVVGLLALLLVGCATRWQVTGPYAGSLSPFDVAQIKQLHASRSTTHYHRITIEALGPARVRVDKLRLDGPSTLSTDFYAVRRGQTWVIAERPTAASPERVTL